MPTMLAVMLVAALGANSLANDPFVATTPGVPGSGGVVPTLAGSGSATPNSANMLLLSDAAPSASALLVFSMSELAAPFAGGILGPAPDFIASLGATNARGTLDFRFRMPPDVPPGLELWMQMWIADTGGVAGLAASNTVKAMVQPPLAASVLFAGAQFAPTFDQLQAMVLADLNSDGHLDLIAVNRLDFFTSGYVDILLGDGHREFSAPIRYPTLGDDSNAVAVGDLDGDGALDLIVANRSSNNVTILRGNGDGTLAPAELVPVPGGPWDVALADLNDDSVLDLLVSGIDADTLSVLFGEGDATFSLPTIYSVGDGPRGIAIADLNADSLPDVVVACESSDSIVLLFGEGRGQLAAAQFVPTGDGPDDLVIGDMDADGALDLVVANRLSDDIAVLLGSGDGSFGPPVTHAAGDGPIFVALRDLDADGALDVAVANVSSNDVMIFPGTGAGQLGLPETYRVGTNPRSLQLEDLDGDGIAELIVGNAANKLGVQLLPGEVLVLQGIEQGAFLTPSRLQLPSESAGLVAGDLNRDGNIDLITALVVEDLFEVRLGSGDGSFSEPVSFPLPVAFFQALALGDVNHDRELDLVVSDTITQTIGIMLGDGSGEFAEPTWFAAGGGSFDVVLADINIDGHSDLLCANTFEDNVAVLFGAGDGTFAEPLLVPAGSAPFVLAVGDFDMNGFPEIAVAPNFSDTVTLLFNIGQGELGKTSSIHAGSFTTAVATEDVNADGILDLIVTVLIDPDDSDFGNVAVLLGNGDGSFGSITRYRTRIGPLKSVLGDLDGDGVIDIAVANGQFDVSVLLGVGDGSFGPAANFQSGDNIQTLVLADVNSDETLDIVAGGFTDELWIYLNQLAELQH